MEELGVGLSTTELMIKTSSCSFKSTIHGFRVPILSQLWFSLNSAVEVCMD